ncbi:hypothetical protein H0H81_009424 [Sphagnurus paluster]|uniref:SnoaL-like domain-containing protein n=1 Tax=Sphagnurus paluster TaxID=117069 RepID=A0A9P7FWB5_9AGAR|nr:hypothetical protein H0H81_009424 [Sphagnurus paluster]
MAAISPHLQLAHAWIRALNEKKIDQLGSLLADDFLSTVRPASMGIKPLDKEGYLQSLRSIPMKVLTIAIPAAADVVETQDVVQFYTTSEGRSTHGFEYKNEYMFTFTFMDDGLIHGIVEFLDPTAVAEMSI